MLPFDIRLKNGLYCLCLIVQEFHFKLICQIIRININFMEKGSEYWNRQNQTADTHKVEFFKKSVTY